MEKRKYMTNRKYLNNVMALLMLMASAPTVRSQEEGKIIDKVVAVVGESIVLHSDLEEQVDQMSMSDMKVTENTRCELLEDLMYQKLFVNQARLDSVVVSEDQIEQELNRRLRYFISQIGSEEELVKYYGKTIDEIKQDFRDEVEEILLIQQMQQTVIGTVKVSPAEVREFYASIPKDSLPYINAQVKVAHIVRRPPVSHEEEEEIREKLRGFKKRVEAGEDFGTLAYLYSQDPGSAQKNGELGFLDRSELVPEFANAATGLSKGEISDVVKTEYGYHIIQMIDRKGDRINVRHILLIPQVSPADLQRAKLYLDSLKQQIGKDSLTFAKAAIKFSDDVDTRMNGGEMVNPADGTNMFDVETLGQIDRNLLFTVQKLKEGEIAGPELYQGKDGKRAYRLVQLIEMTEPHVANLEDDYHRLQETTKRKKENLKLAEWINEHKSSAYIWIDPIYRSCPFETKWTIAER